MADTTTRTTQLEMRWVEVTDEHGRARMEARWVDPVAAMSTAHAA